MDDSNHLNITSHEGYSELLQEKIIMMRSHDEIIDDLNVPDPYFAGIEGFEAVYTMLAKANSRFIDLSCSAA